MKICHGQNGIRHGEIKLKTGEECPICNITSTCHSPQNVDDKNLPNLPRGETGETIDENVNFKQKEMELWSQLVVTVAGSIGCNKKENTVSWANYITEKFREKYK